MKKERTDTQLPLVGLEEKSEVLASQRQSVEQAEPTASLVVGRSRTKSERKLCKDGVYRMIPRARTKDESTAVFWTKVQRGGEDECWPCLGMSKENGNGMIYGVFWDEGKIVPAHRFSYEIHNGTLQDHPKQLACHSCDNPICVNPKHLFAGTYKDNNHDSLVKGRKASAKLSPSQVVDILSRVRGGHSRKDVAALFNVTRTNIDYICKGTTWNHLHVAHADGTKVGAV